MKKNALIILLSITAISWVSYGFKSQIDPVAGLCKTEPNLEANPDFVYLIESRFNSTITKQKLQTAKSIIDIFPAHATNGISDFQNTKIALLPNQKKSIQNGKGEILNQNQLALLQLADYSTDFYLRAEYVKNTLNTNQVERDHIIYYMSVVPEKEASYQDGQSALINYLKKNSIEETLIAPKDKLSPGKIRFTVTEKGHISNVILESTSGHQVIDQTMMELVTTVPGNWNPATNSKGENVAQELVFFFGIAGC